MCTNICFTNKQLRQNIKVDDFLYTLNGVKFFGKLYFSLGSRKHSFLLSGVPLIFQEINLGTAVLPFSFQFEFFVVLSFLSAFNERSTLASGNSKLCSVRFLFLVYTS